MQDGLDYGKTFRVLNVIDDFNRDVLWSIADISIGLRRLIREQERLVAIMGRPSVICVDNGPELTSTNFQL
ncbi:hypothetical protein [Flagellimonas sp.]|uniref:hypothetical protein n=1 Tax=Flagellimonas sp. TaxID=2058762 RepID=UPI003BB03EBE